MRVLCLVQRISIIYEHWYQLECWRCLWRDCDFVEEIRTGYFQSFGCCKEFLSIRCRTSRINLSLYVLILFFLANNFFGWLDWHFFSTWRKSVFGYVKVLPGAFSIYRSGEGPLQKYFLIESGNFLFVSSEGWFKLPETSGSSFSISPKGSLAFIPKQFYEMTCTLVTCSSPKTSVLVLASWLFVILDHSIPFHDTVNATGASRIDTKVSKGAFIVEIWDS